MGGKTYRAFLWGMGIRTIQHALQNQFWRPQEVGLVWSVPISSKGNDRAWTNGGENVSWVGGIQKRFGEG